MSGPEPQTPIEARARAGLEPQAQPGVTCDPCPPPYPRLIVPHRSTSLPYWRSQPLMQADPGQQGLGPSSEKWGPKNSISCLCGSRPG